jgi:hypothetical protein
MPSTAHDREAVVREHEVTLLHPNAVPKHLLAPLSTRILLRSFEKVHGERELKVVRESFLTSVVDQGEVFFYAGSEPVWRATTVAVSRVAGIQNVFNRQSRGDVWPVLRITGRLADDSFFDLDFEVFHLVDGELEHVRDLDGEVVWWVEATDQ